MPADAIPAIPLLGDESGLSPETAGPTVATRRAKLPGRKVSPQDTIRGSGAELVTGGLARGNHTGVLGPGCRFVLAETADPSARAARRLRLSRGQISQALERARGMSGTIPSPTTTEQPDPGGLS
jgi:hypothetical protein